MAEIAQPFALPCFSFKNFCPTFRFKRLVKKENIPSRDVNPIVFDKKFIEIKEKDSNENESENIVRKINQNTVDETVE